MSKHVVHLLFLRVVYNLISALARGITDKMFSESIFQRILSRLFDCNRVWHDLLIHQYLNVFWYIFEII